MSIFGIGRMLHYRLAGRSQNVLFNLHLIDSNIEYKKLTFFIVTPLPDLRPDLVTSGYPAFAYMFGFVKFRITTELWCLVIWSAHGLDYPLYSGIRLRIDLPVCVLPLEVPV